MGPNIQVLKDPLNSYFLNLYPRNTYCIWDIYCMNTTVIGEPKILYCKRRSVKENILWWGIPRDIWKEEYIGGEIPIQRQPHPQVHQPMNHHHLAS
jgi:hypothetical protein